VGLADAAGRHQALARAACGCARVTCAWLQGFFGYCRAQLQAFLDRLHRLDQKIRGTGCARRMVPRLGQIIWRIVLTKNLRGHSGKKIAQNREIAAA